MKKAVAVVVLLVGLLLEPSLGAVHSASAMSSSLAREHTCYLESIHGFRDFLYSAPAALSDGEREHVEAQVQEKCKAVPIRLSSFPASVVSAVRSIPAVRFVLDRLHSSPEHKLALLSQHHALATQDFTVLLQTDEGLLGVERRVQGLASTLMPFWVKGDPGSSNGICYGSHLVTYVVSWLFVGAFLCNFLTSAVTGVWTSLTASLGAGAFATEGIYALLLLVCGLAEEARTQMTTGTKCTFHKRYFINFATAMMLGFMWTISRKSKKDYLPDHESIAQAKERIAKQLGNTNAKGGEDEAQNPEEQAALNAMHLPPPAPHEDSEEPPTDEEGMNEDRRKVERDAFVAEQARLEEKEMEDGGTSRVKGVLARMVNRKFALPFLIASCACMLSFAMLC